MFQSTLPFAGERKRSRLCREGWPDILSFKTDSNDFHRISLIISMTLLKI